MMAILFWLFGMVTIVCFWVETELVNWMARGAIRIAFVITLTGAALYIYQKRKMV